MTALAEGQDLSIGESFDIVLRDSRRSILSRLP